MVTNYYTLKALAEEWSADLPGCIVGDVYSQSRDEITLALASPEKTWMLRASTGAFKFIFRSAGYNKARRNVAPLFQAALDKKISAVRIADRDRVLFLDLDDGSSLQFLLFGPRANVLFADANNVIIDAFQRKNELDSQPAPASRPAPWVDTYERFLDRWISNQKSVNRAISAAFPFLNADLAREVVARTPDLPEKPSDCTEAHLNAIFTNATQLEKELDSPKPCIYWREQRVEQLTLAAFQSLHTFQPEQFESVDKAVSVFVKRKLGQRAFDGVFVPLDRALQSAYTTHSRRLETMLASLSEESRAGKYENWGHLLMANPTAETAGEPFIQLEDLFSESTTVEIPLDPALSVIENAQRYYEKARKTRQARTHAEERLEQVEQLANNAKELLDALRALTTRSDVEKFARNEADRLAPFLGQKTQPKEQVPFRRIPLSGGYEVWVGKNAKQNDALTFQYARKFDYWLHARGVPGSHTVLRRPGRTSQPDKQILESAAAIAAFYSKARGSHLVPVIVTERKYVRKPKGAPIGTVIVEKEQVILIEPDANGTLQVKKG